MPVPGFLLGAVLRYSDSAAEAIEIEVQPSSPAVGMSLAEIHLPHEMIVGGIVRGDWPTVCKHVGPTNERTRHEDLATSGQRRQ